MLYATITEDEFYSVQDVYEQLGMVIALLTPGSSAPTATQWLAFYSQLEQTLSRFVDAVNERRAAEDALNASEQPTGEPS